MRLYLFAQQYPSPYKPYYDTQFADFVKAGHDVSIFAAGRSDSTNEKVRLYGLADRTTYFPNSGEAILARIPHYLRQILTSPLKVGRALAAASAPDTGPRQYVVSAVRACSFPRSAPDLCLVHGLGTAALLPWLKRLYRHTPIAMYYHGGEVPTVRELLADHAKAAFDMPDVVFTNTNFSRCQAIERGCPAAKVEVLPVGFDPNEYRPGDRRSYRREGILRILSAGRMSEEKGFIFALKALKTLVENGVRNVRYSLAGEGYLRQQLEEYVRSSGLADHVTFLGTLSTEGMIRAMGDCDVLLLPSIPLGNWAETQACAVQEAMLMKALVVTSSTGGVPESIPAAMRQFSTAPGDAASIASAIRAILALSASEMEVLGGECRRFVIDRYDIGTLNSRLIQRTLNH